jgi:hypothetical protein
VNKKNRIGLSEDLMNFDLSEIKSTELDENLKTAGDLKNLNQMRKPLSDNTTTYSQLKMK